MNITLRPFQKEDAPFLEDIIRKTWHYDDFCSTKTSRKLAKIFLCSCLTNQTFSRVALLNPKPVGIILGKNCAVHKCPLPLRIRQISSITSLLFSGEGRKTAKIFQDVDGIDKELLKECGTSYPAELALFAVDPECRGKGIGKTLFQSFLDYLKECQLSNFYLYTDTSCNYGFYEHQGMFRRREKTKSFHIKGQDVTMRFFIYDYILPL